MAFGFKRLPGRSRRHINLSATDSRFALGEEISDRQYRAYLDSLGARGSVPGVRAIRDTERQLEAQRAALAARAAQLAAQGAALDTREADLALRERELALEKQLFRRARTDAGQRRYNTVLDAYVRTKRAHGVKITKIEARKSVEFKAIMGDIRGKPNKRNNPNIADQNLSKRKRALDAIGGGASFREIYELLYGTADGHELEGFRSRRRVA